MSEQELEKRAQDNLSILNDSLDSFEWLLKHKYSIKLASKGKEIIIELVFFSKTFIHLAGINKLVDVSFPYNTSRGALYREIIKDKKLRKQIAASIYFDGILGRLYSIIDLKENFEDAENNRHFKFVKKISYNYSSIDYDFFIRSQYENDTYYYFLRYSSNQKNPNECVLISTFIDNVKDYSRGQESMTLLRKAIVELDSGAEIVIFDRKTKI